MENSWKELCSLSPLWIMYDCLLGLNMLSSLEMVWSFPNLNGSHRSWLLAHEEVWHSSRAWKSGDNIAFWSYLKIRMKPNLDMQNLLNEKEWLPGLEDEIAMWPGILISKDILAFRCGSVMFGNAGKCPRYRCWITPIRAPPRGLSSWHWAAPSFWLNHYWWGDTC